MLVDRNLAFIPLGCPQHLAGTYSYPWVKDMYYASKCFAQEHNATTLASARDQAPSPEVQPANSVRSQWL